MYYNILYSLISLKFYNFLNNKYNTVYDNRDDDFLFKESEFPIIKVYKFYYWEDIMKGYLEIIYNSEDFEEIDNNELYEDVKKFIEIINGDEDTINRLFLELKNKKEDNL